MKRSLTRTESRNLCADLRAHGLDGYAANIEETAEAIKRTARLPLGDVQAAYDRHDRANAQGVQVLKNYKPSYWPAATEGKAQEVKA